MRSVVISAALITGLLFTARLSEAGAFILNPNGTFSPIPARTDPNGYGIGANAQYYGINDLGQVSGSYLYQIAATRFYIGGFVYSDGAYSSISGPGSGGGAQAYGINNAGQVVINDGRQSYIYSSGSYTLLNIPIDSEAQWISNSGDIVGANYDDVNNRYTFLYKNGVLTILPTPPGATGIPFANGVNSADQVVGYDYGFGSFLYSSGVFTSVHVPGSLFTSVYGINDSGEIVGSYTDAQDIHGFSYWDGVYTTIDYNFGVGQGTLALSVSDNGQILGTTVAYSPPTPEPSTALLISLGLTCFAALARRSRISQ